MQIDELADEDNTQNDAGDDEDDDGEAVDMEEFEESGMLEMVDPVSRIFVNLSMIHSYNGTNTGDCHYNSSTKQTGI